MSKASEYFSAQLSLAVRIHTVRGQAIILDSDLAEVFEVETKALNRAVRRNATRFPEQFAFQLKQDEWDILRCQFGTSSPAHGGRRYPPWVFTEHGSVMLATVLNSDRAIQASIAVIDSFVRLRHILNANRELARKVEALDEKVGGHGKAIAIIFQELNALRAIQVGGFPS